MIGYVPLGWTRVKFLVESHIRTIAHDSFGKDTYFWHDFGKATTFWHHLGIYSLKNHGSITDFR